MLYLQVIQADFGDCLIVEYGTPSHPNYMLVDGGPRNTYQNHLKAELQKIKAAGGHLKLAVLSHVDSDHVTGLLDLFADLEEARAEDVNPVIAVDALWENAFDKTIGSGTDVEPRMMGLLATAAARNVQMANTAFQVRSIGQGNQLRIAALSLNIPIDPGFGEKPITVETAPTLLTMDNLTLQVVGPTQKNLERLRKDWQDWLDQQEAKVSALTAEAPPPDTSVPNLSSIMFLLQSGKKRILLTGDGLASDLLDGLDRAGLLVDGKIHVDVFKMPHHGSARNVTPQLLRQITASAYVFSADGTDDNPDLDTLLWVVDAAKERDQHIRILVTNKTPSTKELLAQRPKKTYNYTLSILNSQKNSIRV